MQVREIEGPEKAGGSVAVVARLSNLRSLNSWVQADILKGNAYREQKRVCEYARFCPRSKNLGRLDVRRRATLMPRPVERFLAAERVEVHGPGALDEAWGNWTEARNVPLSFTPWGVIDSLDT